MTYNVFGGTLNPTLLQAMFENTLKGSDVPSLGSLMVVEEVPVDVFSSGW